MLSFNSVEDRGAADSVMMVCILEHLATSRITVAKVPDCDTHVEGVRHSRLIARFAARTEETKDKDDIVYCVGRTQHGELVQEAGECGLSEIFTFAVPGKTSASARTGTTSSDERQSVCMGMRRNGTKGPSKPFAGTSAEICALVAKDNTAGVKRGLKFSVPSTGDLLASLPMGSDTGADAQSGLRSLVTLIQEETECVQFLCPNAARGVYGTQSVSD